MCLRLTILTPCVQAMESGITEVDIHNLQLFQNLASKSVIGEVIQASKIATSNKKVINCPSKNCSSIVLRPDLFAPPIA